MRDEICRLPCVLTLDVVLLGAFRYVHSSSSTSPIHKKGGFLFVCSFQLGRGRGHKSNIISKI